jgi:hypothetical protein
LSPEFSRDSEAIDAALLQHLGSDPELLNLMPNGVYYGLAPADCTAFVLVSIITADDTPAFGGRAFETVTYLVKAVERTDGSQLNARAAARRIDALLEHQRLTIDGYGCLEVRRVHRIRYPETDERDTSIRWEHRGGEYELMAAPASA